MSMFSGTLLLKFFDYLKITISTIVEITHRFQTAREEVRAMLLPCLSPWLQNIELVAPTVPPATPLSYIMVNFNLAFLLVESN